MKIINSEKCVVFFDFDNTISTCDCFDNMLPRFSQDDLWVDLEKKRKKGKVGYRDCLEGQIKGMGITKSSLDSYLSGVRLDPYFKKIVRALDSKGVKTIVLSDNFDYILKRILGLRGIKNLKIYSNILVPLVSIFFLHEKVTLLRWAGIFFILTGAVFVSLSSKERERAIS